MLRLTFISLGLAVTLSGCAEYASPTPPQPGLVRSFSESIGYSGIGYEPHSTGFSNPG